VTTRLVFRPQAANGNQLAIRVDKSPEDVFKEWIRAGDLPFALERENGGRVYVNPRAIAFWEEASEEPGSD
jgi:hypothetical protein